MMVMRGSVTRTPFRATIRGSASSRRPHALGSVLGCEAREVIGRPADLATGDGQDGHNRTDVVDGDVPVVLAQHREIRISADLERSDPVLHVHEPPAVGGRGPKGLLAREPLLRRNSWHGRIRGMTADRVPEIPHWRGGGPVPWVGAQAHPYAALRDAPVPRG